MIPVIRQSADKPHDETGINNRNKDMPSCAREHYLPLLAKYIEYKNSAVSAAATEEMDVRGLTVEDVVPEDETIDENESGEDVEEEMSVIESEV